MFVLTVDEDDNELYVRRCGQKEEFNGKDDRCESWSAFDIDYSVCVCDYSECNGSSFLKASMVLVVFTFLQHLIHNHQWKYYWSFKIKFVLEEFCIWSSRGEHRSLEVPNLFFFLIDFSHWCTNCCSRRILSLLPVCWCTGRYSTIQNVQKKNQISTFSQLLSFQLNSN